MTPFLVSLAGLIFSGHSSGNAHNSTELESLLITQYPWVRKNDPAPPVKKVLERQGLET